MKSNVDNIVGLPEPNDDEELKAVSIEISFDGQEMQSVNDSQIPLDMIN